MRIVVGVSGGVAAYKACELVSRLVQTGHEVRVVMTPRAADFVGPLTFRALSGHAVGSQSVDEPEGPLSHIALSHWAEALIIAPATASLIARLAHGHADDLLSLVYLGFRGPVVMAPAMEPDMWTHPRTQANVSALSADGVDFMGPNAGRLASGRSGPGRMAEPSEILARIARIGCPNDLAGLTFVVTAGATWEHFDPVRILTNPSTGMMGVEIANQANRRGARVYVVTGPRVQGELDPGVRRCAVTSAEEMRAAVMDWIDEADIFVGAAAVSDFRPAEQLAHKAHKEDVGLAWSMERTPDIIREIAGRYQGQKLLIGFAAETEQAVERAALKRTSKGLDLVVANVVGQEAGFGTDPHQAWLVSRSGSAPVPGGTKADTARALLDWIAKSRGEQGAWNS
jgi:phosphopantothenoylcysteine decarboxylase/phosphopantothenate--cysteine ligase